MDTFVIDHPHNEASALLALHRPTLLEEFGWTRAFWIASDEAPAHRAVAVLGVRGDRDEHDARAWQVERVSGRRSKRSTHKRTEDVETLCRAGAWIYVIGSQFGSKSGPLEPHRHFLARFNESLVRCENGKLEASFHVVRAPFLLHRLINDALAASDLEILPAGDAERREQIRAALERAENDGLAWRRRLEPDDWPINIEGATFVPSGRLLLGLRYPVSADGQPLLVEVEGIDRLFAHKGGDPAVTRIWRLKNVGSRAQPAGVRELDQLGTTIHVVTGDLDSEPDESVVIADHPEGTRAASAHWTFELPTRGESDVEARPVRRFDADATIEGVCVDDDGTVWYVHDDDCIRLERATPGESDDPDQSARRGWDDRARPRRRASR
jgi:hypothetical protein